MKVLLLVIAGVCFVSPTEAVPLPAEKPIRWEYAEIVGRSPRGGQFAPGVAPGEEAQPRPAQPGPAALPAFRWITSTEEFGVKSWEELAEKLKAPAPAKKDSSVLMHKMRVFDKLGAEGWELVSQPSGSSVTGAAGTWIFKRRVP